MLRGIAAASQAGAHRPLSAPYSRSAGSDRGLHRGARRASERGQDPPHRGVERLRRGARARAPGRAGGLGFLPWYPLAVGDLAKPGGPLDDVASSHGATPAQVALAWLLGSSPVTL